MTTRRKMLGGMVAVAAGGSRAGKMFAGGESFGVDPDEAAVVMLELSQKCDVGHGKATGCGGRRFVCVDLDDEDDLGDLNETSDGENGFVGLGNDEDGYWKVERAFGLAPSAREGATPTWREVPLSAFRAALRRRVACAASC